MYTTEKRHGSIVALVYFYALQCNSIEGDFIYLKKGILLMYIWKYCEQVSER